MHRGNAIVAGGWVLFFGIIALIATVNLAFAVVMLILLGGTALVALEGRPRG